MKNCKLEVSIPFRGSGLVKFCELGGPSSGKSFHPLSGKWACQGYSEEYPRGQYSFHPLSGKWACQVYNLG